MGNFEIKSRYHLYINEDTLERMREIEDHLKQNYDGISNFVEQKMREEQALSLEERIKRKEQDLKKEKEELEQLKTVKEERETQDKLRDKRELLREKQKKLRKIANSEKKTEEEIRDQVLQKMREKAESSPKISDVEEWIESKSTQKRIDRKVSSRLDSNVEVDELVKDVQRLQEQVKELNGGREDYFMDLEKVDEVEA